MTKTNLYSILFIFVIAASSITLKASACSELGKQEFTLDKKISAKCGKLAQDIAIQVGTLSFPKLHKSEGSATRPSAPFRSGGLTSIKSDLSYSAAEVLQKNKDDHPRATFSITINTSKGNWECLYCVTFNIIDENCSFQKIVIDHCAGDVRSTK